MTWPDVDGRTTDLKFTSVLARQVQLTQQYVYVGMHEMKVFGQRGTLYCFSPPVMVATLLIESALAIFVFLRHSITRFGKVAGLLLVLLAAFQFAEYQTCIRTSEKQILWARIGFVAITLLPIAGLYLVSLVSGKQHFLKLGYATAIAFVVYFLIVPKSIFGAICGGNYVIFNTSNDLYRLYGLYYWGFLLLGIWEAIEKIETLKRQLEIKKTLQWLIVGYLSFMGPMGIVYIVFPTTRGAVTSIMCGFAITLAFILALKVVPAYNRAHRHRLPFVQPSPVPRECDN